MSFKHDLESAIEILAEATDRNPEDIAEEIMDLEGPNPMTFEEVVEHVEKARSTTP